MISRAIAQEKFSNPKNSWTNSTTPKDLSQEPQPQRLDRLWKSIRLQAEKIQKWEKALGWFTMSNNLWRKWSHELVASKLPKGKGSYNLGDK